MRTRLPLPRGWNRRVRSSILHGRWDSYAAGTTFAGELSPLEQRTFHDTRGSVHRRKRDEPRMPVGTGVSECVECS